jgi:Uma2 family endonuclease
MSLATTPLAVDEQVVYPETDGQPMADNTLQFEWIVTFQGGIDALFRHDPNVFVAGDLFWYPVEGDPNTRVAPDVMVVFGRPKGHRRSYQQWREDGIAPQVVFEVLSSSNTIPEMVRKHLFYQRYGVEEYYLYDPERNLLTGWRREGEELREIPEVQDWVSPRLGVRFDLDEQGLQLLGPDGEPFATYVELVEQREQERREKERERQEKERERQEKEREQARAERLAAQLRSLGVEPEA